MWHSCFWWIQKCWKTDNFDFLAILELRGQICNFELATLRQKLKLDLSLCFIYFSSGWSSVVLHISTLHFKYLPKYFKHFFWKYSALELYFWSSESGTRLSFVKSESGSEYGAVTQAVRRLLHNSKRVLMMMMMMIIIHPFDHHHVVSPSLSFDEDDDDCGSFFYFTFYPYVDGDDDDDWSCTVFPGACAQKSWSFSTSRVDGSWVLLNKMSMNDDDDLSVMMMMMI